MIKTTFTGRATINLYCGDCMSALAGMNADQYNLAIVDPPYAHNSRNAYPSRLKKYGDLSYNDKKPPPEYFKLLQEKSCNQIIWGGNYFLDWLGNTKCQIFWWKHQPVKTYASGEIAWTSFQDRHSNIFDYKYFGAINREVDRMHPNQKPVALYKWLLTNYAKEGDTILDTHGGSFSLAIACWDLGFDLDAYEIDADYYKAGVDRVRRHVNQMQFEI